MSYVQKQLEKKLAALFQVTIVRSELLRTRTKTVGQAKWRMEFQTDKGTKYEVWSVDRARDLIPTGVEVRELARKKQCVQVGLEVNTVAAEGMLRAAGLYTPAVEKAVAAAAAALARSKLKALPKGKLNGKE